MTDSADGGSILDRLFVVVESRRGADPGVSHTASLLAQGTEGVARKVGEEAVETMIAALKGKPPDVVKESADLLYHLLVLWAAAGVTPADVWRELEAREGTSGLAEKKARGET